MLVIQPTKTIELARIYWDLNNNDAMIGIHNMMMTHLLFIEEEVGKVTVRVVENGGILVNNIDFFGVYVVKIVVSIFDEIKVLWEEIRVDHGYPCSNPTKMAQVKQWVVTQTYPCKILIFLI